LGRESLQHYVCPRRRALIGIVFLPLTRFDALPFSADLHHEYWLEKLAS
jgi:hypothetical protein